MTLRVFIFDLFSSNLAWESRITFFYSRNPLILKKQQISKNMKILFITIVLIVVMLYMHRRHCTNDPLMITGKKLDIYPTIKINIEPK